MHRPDHTKMNSLSFNRHFHNANKPLRKAAVLMPLVQRENGLNLIFTQRALHLKHHPGQISFPGGKHEITDASLAFTALRETEEEIGIAQNKVNIIGSLPPLTTNSGFHVTPYIGLLDDTHGLQIDLNEVETCFEAPLAFMLNPEHFSTQRFMINNTFHKTYCCHYKQHLIWGATAQMVMNLQQHFHD